MKYNLLGVGINKVYMDQAVDQISEWLSKNQGPKTKDWQTKYVVTPNVEFLVLAQKDRGFKEILNNADLAIPDSARLSWGYYQTHTKNPILKLLTWPLFLVPNLLPVKQFDIVTGTDLMEQLIRECSDKGVTIGLLGGQKKVAERLRERLLKKYPLLKISYANSRVVVDSTGEVLKIEDGDWKIGVEGGRSNIDKSKTPSSIVNPQPTIIHNPSSTVDIPPTDILFVAFGQGKQEKWIYKNLDKHNVKVMIGVGGAFDYLLGEVPRAPKLIRQMGFEYLYRLINQPWRIKRFGALLKFLGLVLIRRD